MPGNSRDIFLPVFVSGFMRGCHLELHGVAPTPLSTHQGHVQLLLLCDGIRRQSNSSLVFPFECTLTVHSAAYAQQFARAIAKNGQTILNGTVLITTQ